VLARYQSDRLVNFIEGFIEGRMGLVINRGKTKIVNLKNTGESLNFLGFTFHYDRDTMGRNRRYLNITPSKKSVQRMREKIKTMTDKTVCFKPIDELIIEINRILIGWSNYFRFGYPAVPFRKINSYTVLRLTKHLKRRSQRGFHPPKGDSYYSQIYKFGLTYLK
jgi:RNA-directed DNA polymerase